METGKVTGIVSVIEPTKTYGEKGFKKRLVVLEQQFGETWTSYIPVEFCRHDCEVADNLTEGDEVTIEYQLTGRKWQKDFDAEPRYFLAAQFVSYSEHKKQNEEAGETAHVSKTSSIPSIDINEERPVNDDVPF